MSCRNEDRVKEELRQCSNALEKEMMSVLQELRTELMNEQSKLIEAH